MKGAKNPLGYTIIEVMIVLAVSGVMFLIALNFISGKQGKTAFQQGSNEMASRIQGVISQIINGQYTDIPLTCTSSPAGISISNTVKAQGTNPNCVFLGKMMHFATDQGANTYEIFSFVGNRLQTSGVNAGQPAITLASTQLKAVDPNAGSAVNLTRQYSTSQNLDVKDVKVKTPGGTVTTYGFGFMQGLGALGVDKNGVVNYQSGTQTVKIVYINTLPSGKSQSDAANAINTGIKDDASSACVALYDGIRGALVNVGGDNSGQLSVAVKQLGQVPEAAAVCP